MWYWDYTPSWGNHQMKPLTKAQLKKIQEAYKNADIITSEIRSQEAREQEWIKKEIEDWLNLFL